MLRRLWAYALLFLLIAAIPRHESFATTVRPVREVCPVCAHDFVSMEIASYTHFGCRERDFSDMPFALFGKTKTCPHCLYSAVSSSFAAGGPKLRGELNALTQTLDGARVKKLAFPRDEELLRLGIAQACLKWRDAPLKEQVDTQLRVYFASKRAEDKTLLTEERSRLLELLEKALGAGTYVGADEALFTYLRGELQRLSGNETAAMLLFIKTKTLVAKLPKPERKDDGSEWLAEWADEQTRRIVFPKKSVEELDALIGKGGLDRKVALIALAERKEPAAWQCIAKYVMSDTERLLELEESVELTREKMQRDPEFWRWGVEQFKHAQEAEKKGNDRQELTRYRNRFAHLFGDARSTWQPKAEHAGELAKALRKIAPNFIVKHTVEKGDFLSGMAARFGFPIFRIQELNPQIQNKDQIRAGQEIRRLVLPEGWDEKQVLRHLPLTIASGESAATAFFIEWAQSIGLRGSDEYSYEIGQVLHALPRGKGIEAALNIPPASDDARRLMRLALRLIAGDVEAEKGLIDLLKTRTEFGSDQWTFAAEAFIAAKNPGMKAVLFEHGKTGMTNGALGETLKALGTEEDIPMLERRVERLPLTTPQDQENNIYARQYFEAMLVRLKLKLLAEACAKGK